MRTKINITAVIFMLLFLSGCSRKESGMQNAADVSATIGNGDEVSSASIEAEGEGDILKEAETQYPLIATLSSIKRIDLVLVSEETYCIFDGDKYGFVREDGEEITPFIYDIAYPFSEGLACVYEEGKYGYIDVEGETAIPFAYDRATPFMEGLAYFAAGDSYGFMDKTGNPVFYFECDSVSSFQEGLACFCRDGYYGYIDQQGQIAIEPVFDDAGYFKEGLAKVMKEGRYGVINRDGDLIIETEYDSIDVDDTFIIAQSDGKYACFDRTGKELLAEADYISYVYLTIGEKEKYVRFEKEEKEGLLDEKGHILIEPLYELISELIPEQNLAVIREDGSYGVVDFQGEVKIPAVYDYIYYDSYADSAEGGMFILKSADGSRESVNAVDFSEGIPCDYDSIDWIDENRAIVSQNGLSGIVDREGHLIEPVVYDVIRLFADDGSVWMRKDENTWFYNSQREEMETIGYFDDISQEGSCYQTEKDGKFGFLNEKREEMVTPVYDRVWNQEVYGSDKVYISTQYGSSGYCSVVKTGEPKQADVSEALLQNEITPRIGVYQEFIKNGSASMDDADSGYITGQENLKEYRKTYKLYDLDHSGEPVLFFYAEPYASNNAPVSYSGFYVIRDNQLVELVSGNECGGSKFGDYACLWYDRETSQVLPGTNGTWGGSFGGYSYLGVVYDQKDGEMYAVSFGYKKQAIMFYSEEELANEELFYDEEGRLYTKEEITDAEYVSAWKYSVNGVQTTIEEYQEMRDRYRILYYVE